MASRWTSGTLLAIAAFAILPGAARGQAAADVHVLTLVAASGDLIPTPSIVASQRLALDPAIGSSRITQRVDGRRLILTLVEDDGQLYLEREFTRGTRRESLSGRIFDVVDPYRFTRRPRRGAYTRVALICDLVTDVTKPFQPMDVRAFFQNAVDVLFDARSESIVQQIEARLPRGVRNARAARNVRFDVGSDRWKASLVLGAVPIEDYLDPAQVDRILDAGAKVERHLDEDSWAFLRPLVALGDHATLRALAARSADRQALRQGIALTPEVPRSIHDAVLVAYASATDPTTRGLAAWVATGTRLPDLIDALAEDLKANRAILPGSPEEQQKLADHIVTLQAWQSVRKPAIALGASAVVIGLALWLLKRTVRGWC
jgi:hypothetical protein